MVWEWFTGVQNHLHIPREQESRNNDLDGENNNEDCASITFFFKSICLLKHWGINIWFLIYGK